MIAKVVSRFMFVKNNPEVLKEVNDVYYIRRKFYQTFYDKEHARHGHI